MSVNWGDFEWGGAAWGGFSEDGSQYSLVYQGVEGQEGLYARIKRILDGSWWNEASEIWAASAAATSNIYLTESTNRPGYYLGIAHFAPMNGGLYAIYVYDASGNFLSMTEHIFRPLQKSVLTMINEVQRELRLPESSAVSEPHAQLVLSFLNKVQSDIMMEAYVWDELKVSGAIATREGFSLYSLAPINGQTVDMVRVLQLGTNEPLTKFNNDAAFRAFRRSNTSNNSPLAYRIYGRAGDALIIELSPAPDESYEQLNYELLVKPARMTAATDIPTLDSDTIIAGALMLARMEQGEDYTADLQAFQSKMGLRGEAQGDSNWGDIEVV